VWSDQIAASAKPWAEHLAALGGLPFHATGQPYGENIAFYQPHGGDTLPKLVSSWVDEKKNYHPGEQVSGSNLYQVGHYTAMVWRDTKQVGCAMATSSSGKYPNSDYLVCRYNPSGNQFNHAPY
jgi:cysteine-rich secretory family protein